MTRRARLHVFSKTNTVVGKLFVFISKKIACDHAAAMARGWDFFLTLKASLRLPLSGYVQIHGLPFYRWRVYGMALIDTARGDYSRSNSNFP